MHLSPAFLTIPTLIRVRPARFTQPCIVCLDGSHRLPHDAYITVGDNNTPMCRVITALWQSYHTYGFVPDAQSLARAISELVDAGFRTFDISSSHTEPPLLPSEYIRFLTPSTTRNLHICTRVDIHPYKFGRVSRHTVERIVDEQLKRIGVDRIHLLQLSCADFRDERYIDFLGELQELRRFGKIRSIGTVNFTTNELRHLASQKIHIASNQISFSLVDRRARVEMADWCRKRQVAMLAYSPLGAGLISERYLGLPEPTRNVRDTPSLMYFTAIIRIWGGWSLFQELLYAVKMVADKHAVKMSDVALNWALQQVSLSAVVFGPSFDTHRSEDYLSFIRTFNFSLDEEDEQLLEAIAKKGNDLHRILGDCGQEFQPRNQQMN